MKTLAVIFSLFLASPAYAGITGWSTSNYLRHSAQVINTYPFMLSIWGYRASAPGSVRIAISSHLSSDGNQRRGQIGISTSETVRAGVMAGSGTFVSANSAASPQDAWFHMCGQFISTTSRAALLNGADRATEGSTRDPTAANDLRIGTRLAAEAWGSADGLAEASAWDLSGFSEANMNSLCGELAAGKNPINLNAQSGQPWTGKLVAYWPLTDTTDINDASENTFNLSTVGTLSNHASHPTIDPVGGPATRARSQTIFLD